MRIELLGSTNQALRQFERIAAAPRNALGQAMHRVGALVRKTAKQYAPISPTTAMLKTFARTAGQEHADSLFLRSGVSFKKKSMQGLGQQIGVRVGTSYTIGATAKREAQTVTLTAWYAQRLDQLLDPDPRSTTRPMPGGLMRSIEMSSDAEKAEIYVPANSPAGKYAKRIHDEKGVTWRERGPGTQAKGPLADDKFIERAITDNQAEITRIIEDQMQRFVGGE